jgi:predicted membrane-bound mannosyltransferase
LPQAGAALPLAALTVAAAVLRFATLGQQSYWNDEAVSVFLLRRPFGGMLHHVASESTPPLYYVLGWPWIRLFGSSEIALRSLSALIGTAMVPVAYAAALSLLRRRHAALAVAALVTVSPFLVYYSQEARPYALAALLSAVALLLFSRVLDEPSSARIWAWAGVSVLAIGTHYFAGFLTAAEAAVILAAHTTRRVATAVAAATAGAAVLVLLAAHQYRSGATSWITQSSSLESRIRGTAHMFVFLTYQPAGGAATIAVVTAVAAFLAYRGRRVGRSRIALAVGGFGVAAPIVLALVGLDVVLYRNLIVAWLPLAIAVAAGFDPGPTFSSKGTLLAGAAVVVALAATLRIDTDVMLQRDSWRNVAHVLKQSRGRRFVIGDQLVLSLYLPDARPVPSAGVRVREVDVALPYVAAASPPEPPSAGFRLAQSARAGNLIVYRFRSRRPLLLLPDGWGAKRTALVR